MTRPDAATCEEALKRIMHHCEVAASHSAIYSVAEKALTRHAQAAAAEAELAIMRPEFAERGELLSQIAQAVGAEHDGEILLCLEQRLAQATEVERARCAQLVRNMAWVARDMDAPQSKIVAETLAQVVKELLRQR
jgi:acyl-CoA reductase-like NAD-dependent aldehyde dehydrogenase